MRTIFGIVAAAVASVLVAAAFLGNILFWQKPSADAPRVSVVIPSGAAAVAVAQLLEESGLIGNESLFLTYLRLTGSAADLQAGTYELKPGLSVSRLVNLLTDPLISDRRITLLEGWGIREMGDYLVAQGALAGVEEWYAVVGTPPSVAGGKKQIPGSAKETLLPYAPAGATLEGFLFPDTYRIAVDATAEDIARTMVENFSKRTRQDLLDAVTSQGKAPDIYATITLASIVEREVRSDEDRRLVADLFLRRMEEGMALQADSTVNYVTGKKTPALSAADRDFDSPWNTYLHRGLPPTPIGNPSLSAIRAVLDPTPNPYVYFLTDAEGAVHYARTFEEHVANKRRYLP